MQAPDQSLFPRSPTRITLRRTISLILLASFIVEVAARFISPQWLAFRAWEAATLYATSEGHFAPNFSYASDHAYGDLAKFGNLPSLRRYHREVFTTDKFGFRNAPGNAAGRPPALLVVGDSFAVGCGVSDQETLSAQLSSLTGKPVYNGGTDYGRWTTTKGLIYRLGIRNGWILWELSEANAARVRTGQFILRPTVPRIDASGENGPPGLVPKYERWAGDFLAYSPVSILVDRALSRIENDRLLPNPSRGAVAIDHLRNGDAMLFLPTDVENFYHPGYSSAEYFSEVNALIAETGNRLLVVLVPSKYAVYHSLLMAPPPLPSLQSNWDRYEKDLLRLGIPTINLTSALRLKAEQGLQDRQYDYFIDDTHWNQTGIHLAATAIAHYLKKPGVS